MVPGRGCRQLLCAFGTLLLSACATKPLPYPTPAEQVSVWLAEAPRTLELRVEKALPAPSIRTRDEQTAKKIGMGAVGAVGGAGTLILEGCAHGGLFGCLVGVVLAPVGAVVGAAVAPGKVKPVDAFHPPGAVPGAAGLFAELHGRRADLPGLLANAIVPKVKGHRIDRDGAKGDGVLQVEFVAVMLAGDVGQDAEVGLLLQARGRITAGDVTAWDWGDFNYEGPKRRIAQWMADDARSLREEMAAAAAALAAQLAEKMREGPSSSATEKVQAWRAKRPH